MNKKSAFTLKTIKPYLFLMPILLFAVGFIYYPFLRTFVYSFSIVDFSGQVVEFVWFENFITLFQNDNFILALRNTLILTVVTVPSTLIISLSMALLASKRRRFSPVYEIMFSLPMAISMTAACMVFKLLLNPTIGIINYALGIDFAWFNDPATALFGIIVICIWMGLPFDFLLFLAAVRNVPDQLIEAAKLDGAGYITRLFRVVIPMITPTILYIFCINLVKAMMTAAPVMLITEGGPARSTTTLIYMMFTSGYQSSNYSVASCLSIITFALTFGIVALSMRFERKRVHYN